MDAVQLTYDQARALGIDVEAVLASAKPLPTPTIPAPGQLARRPRHAVNDRGQNKSEAAFQEHLEGLARQGRITGWAWEPFRVTLAPRCYLRIDFAARLPEGRLALIDVKGGHIEDDACVKLKVAAEKYAWLGDVWIARREKSSWLYWRVGRGGIARDPVGSFA